MMVLPLSFWLVICSNVLAIASAANQTTSSFYNPCANYTSISSMLIPSTGSGPEYASSCYSLQTAYSKNYTSWMNQHQLTTTNTYTMGGTYYTTMTYYKNASTLCDGYPRVNYSPAILATVNTSRVDHTPTTTSTNTGTFWCNYPGPSPTCSIKPVDCDPIWASYSSVRATMPPFPTSVLPTPFCANQSAASSQASFNSIFYGCGPCTMFGQGVQLVYFPPPTSMVENRNFCASTPSASRTHYGSGAIITAYAGNQYQGNDSHSSPGQMTAVANGHTFTSGTAYISIETVYAVDRCSKTYGKIVRDAVLAMPSESVLSLRYSQDHFQYFQQTDKQTGYPVNYADFHTPIPWSAWNGQAYCQGPMDWFRCGIIYENEYRPQLAIPPGIRDLDPAWATCQLWYGGLWDPPLALHPAETVASATLPGWDQPKTTAASPSSAIATTTPTATALPDLAPSSSGNGWPRPNAGGHGGAWEPSSAPQEAVPQQTEQTKSASSSQPPPIKSSACPWSRAVVVGGQTYTAIATGTEIHISTITLVVGGSRQTLDHGVVASYGKGGIVFQGSTTFILTPTTNSIPDCTACYIVNPGYPDGDSRGRSYTVTINGEPMTAYQVSSGAPITIGTMTLTPGGSASTLVNGDILSAATNGLAVQWSSTLDNDIITSTLGPAAQTTAPSATTTQGASRTQAAVTQSSTLPSSASSTHAFDLFSGSVLSSSAASALLITFLACLALS